MKTNANYSISNIYDGDKTFILWGISSSNSSLPTTWTYSEPTPQRIVLIWGKEGHGLDEGSASWGNPVWITGNKGDKGNTGEPGPEVETGKLSIEFSNNTITIKPLQNIGFIKSNGMQLIIPETIKALTNNGEGFVLCNFNDPINCIIKFVRISINTDNNDLLLTDFNTNETVLYVNNNNLSQRYLLIGKFFIENSIIINAEIINPIHPFYYFSQFFLSIISKNSSNSETLTQWLKAFKIDSFIENLAAVNFFVKSIFAQQINIDSTGYIQSIGFDPDNNTQGWRIDNSYLQAVRAKIKKGEFVDADVSGKFSSTSLETFDALPNIDSTWNLSQNMSGGTSLHKWNGWKEITTIDNSYGFLSIAYNEGKYVAVGLYGKGVYSQDGISWTNIIIQGTPSGSSWNSVAYGNGRWVIVGNSGRISTSIDGINWNTPITTDSYNWCSVTFGDNKWLIGGYGGKKSMSFDGISWTVVTSYASSNPAIFYIAYESQKVVAVGMSGKISTSIYGKSWSKYIQVQDQSTTWNSVAYGNGKWVVVGDYGKISTSIDGNSWSSAISLNNSTFDLNSVYYSTELSLFFLVGETGKYATSIDGIIWTPFSNVLDDSSTYWRSIIYNKENKLVAVGYSGNTGKIVIANTLYYNMIPIIDYLSNLIETITPPQGLTPLTEEPLKYFTKVNAILNIDNNYTLTKLKVTTESFSFEDTNKTNNSFDKNSLFESLPSLANLTILGAEEENAVTAIVPKKGNNTGYMGKEGQQFVAVWAKEIHGKVYAS